MRPDLFPPGGITAASKGMLLFGPPGTGKTMVAKALAAQAGFHFFKVDCADVESKWRGEAAKVVSNLFRVARAATPGAIVFLDECDSLLRKAGGGEDASENAKIVNQFKGSMDGVEPSAGRIFVIGATNNPWDLDTAITRPGRMDFRVLVPLPDASARRDMLRRNLKDNSWDPACEQLVLEGTNGFSGADMRAFCKEAAMGPVREATKQPEGSPMRLISEADFKAALQKTPRSVQEEDLRKHRDWDAKLGTRI